jgi:MYXO-CTERM domain-containing protein
VYLNDLSDNFIFDPVFYGITSDKEFYKLEVYVGDLSVSGSAATSYTKPFSWGTPIPAPAAGALLGLAGLAARRRRAR